MTAASRRHDDDMQIRVDKETQGYLNELVEALRPTDTPSWACEQEEKLAQTESKVQAIARSVEELASTVGDI